MPGRSANRAMVANEVAIAQTVSLSAWFSEVDKAAMNISALNAWMPNMAMAIQAISDSGIKSDFTGAAPTILETLSSGVNKALSKSQTSAHSAGFTANTEVIDAVIKANDGDAQQTGASKALLAQYQKSYTDFTQGYGGNQRYRIKGVVIKSPDGFTQQRGWDANFDPDIEFRKRGGTQMVGLSKWEAFDTFSAYTYQCTKSACSWKEKTPTGWGGTKSEKDPTTSSPLNYGGAKTNDQAFDLAKSEEMDLPGYAGLPSSRDVTDRKLKDNDLQTLAFIIEVAKPATKLRSSTLLGIGSGSLQQSGVYAGDEISVLAKAEVYFRYPDNQDYKSFFRKTEYANLYNPFWQARLKSPSLADRLAVLAAKAK